MGHLRIALVIGLVGCGRFGFDSGAVTSAPDAEVDGAADAAPDAAQATAVGLVAHWSFDADLLDDSGNSYAASCSGTCPSTTAGILGNARAVNGTSSCLGVTALASWSSPAFTISAWVKSAAMQGPIVVHESQSGCPSPEMKASGGVGLVQLNTTDSTPHNEAWSTQMIASPGSWHQVAVAWDGAQQSIYIDGQCQCSEPQAIGPLDHAQPFTIGCYPTDSPSATYFAGAIDEVRVYDRVLTLDEMSVLYAVGGGAAPAPVACSIACGVTPP